MMKHAVTRVCEAIQCVACTGHVLEQSTFNQTSTPTPVQLSCSSTLHARDTNTGLYGLSSA